MKENDISLMDETKDELNHIYSRISQLYNMGLDAFSKRRTDNFKKMSNLHKEILDLISKCRDEHVQDRKSTRLNSSHVRISYAVFCLKKKRIIYEWAENRLRTGGAED